MNAGQGGGGRPLRCRAGERQRGTHCPQQRLSKRGRVPVRAAKLGSLGSGNLAVLCPAPKLAERGLAFTAPLLVRSVFRNASWVKCYDCGEKKKKKKG